jgi:hypothetical protein
MSMPGTTNASWIGLSPDFLPVSDRLMIPASCSPVPTNTGEPLDPRSVQQLCGLSPVNWRRRSLLNVLTITPGTFTSCTSAGFEGSRPGRPAKT